LEPHALVFDGFRWHARARDAETDEFRDFVLGRLSKIALGAPAQGGLAQDLEWNSRVALEIAPNPALSAHQRAAIEMDYGMTKGRLVLEVRRAVLYYAKRRLGLTAGHESRPATDQHIVLLRERDLRGPPHTGGRG
jgi:predicted DNA-binding transcriptional regulator YafY